MADFPALPLWTDAYLADCSHLSDAQHGRYLLLLMMIWRAPNTRIPNDDLWLAKKFQRSPERIKKEIRPLIEEFCQNTGNWITQKRLKKEKKFLSAKRKAQSERAKLRWQKEKEVSPRIAAPHRSGNAPTPTPTPTPTPNELNSNSHARNVEKPVDKLGTFPASVYEAAKNAAPGFDVYALESEWRQWVSSKRITVQNQAAHFINFCKRHAQANR